jgi:Tol biopolymer transport system component
MGEVYRATDTNLKRQVALKVLPVEVGNDPDRLARFQREAEILAALNHPHIAAIYGLEEAANLHFLVLELVEGETLAERLARGPMRVRDAIPIAIQICEALEAAHEKGIVHRDLKPANIKLTPQGVVKVLDFGLATVFDAGLTTSGSSTLPTMMASHTAMVVGTPAYMSPEQATARHVDRTSDVWAFGCSLFEMLTGTAPFARTEIDDVISAILNAEPDWQRLPPDSPEGIRRLLRRCLQKDRRARLHDIADARIEMQDDGIVANPADRRPDSARWRERLVWSCGVTALLVAATWLAILASRQSPAGRQMRVDVTTPASMNALAFAISPDGQSMVFAAATDGRPRLWLRSLDSGSLRPLSQTDDATSPFWSPDSRSIGFFADGKLKRVDVDGELTRVLARSVADFGGTWNRDGVILFSPTPSSPLMRVSANGGDVPVGVRTLTPGQGSARSPQFLADGRHFLFYVQGENHGIYVGELGHADSHRLLDADAAIYAAPDRLLFVRQRKLYAQTFNQARTELTGNPYLLDEPVSTENGLAPVSASATSAILYRTGGVVGRRQLVWVDRSGAEVGRVGEPDDNNPLTPEISPDGRFVALSRSVDANQDVWLLDTTRGVLSRFTSDVGSDAFPIWSPDSKSIVFNSARRGVFDLYRKSIDGSGAEELVLATPLPKGPTDWSPDGRVLLYRSPGPETGLDIWALPLERDQKPFAVVQTMFDERDAKFSPDGRWIAFESNESGQREIYVRPFPGPGSNTRVSRSGGAQARWRADGRELFYVALDGRMMAVPVQFGSDGRVFEAGEPLGLFATRIGGAAQTRNRQQYVVSTDGRRFLMNNFVDESTLMRLIVNWKGVAGTP